MATSQNRPCASLSPLALVVPSSIVLRARIGAAKEGGGEGMAEGYLLVVAVLLLVKPPVLPDR